MKIRISETDLAKIVIELLSEWGWDVYQEVQGHGGICDIVGKRGNILWAIECKKSFGLAVIEQAHNWIKYAHYSSVAVPQTRDGYFAEQICREYGIGVFRIKGETPRETIRPKMHRAIIPLHLYEEQKTFCEAGSANGGHWTDFKRTVRNLVREVELHPGMEFNKAIKVIDHHYSSFGSAKSCLRGFIGTVIPELRVEIVNRKLCVFLSDAKTETGDK